MSAKKNGVNDRILNRDQRPMLPISHSFLESYREGRAASKIVEQCHRRELVSAQCVLLAIDREDDPVIRLLGDDRAENHCGDSQVYTSLQQGDVCGYGY